MSTVMPPSSIIRMVVLMKPASSGYTNPGSKLYSLSLYASGSTGLPEYPVASLKNVLIESMALVENLNRLSYLCAVSDTIVLPQPCSVTYGSRQESAPFVVSMITFSMGFCGVFAVLLVACRLNVNVLMRT